MEMNHLKFSKFTEAQMNSECFYYIAPIDQIDQTIKSGILANKDDQILCVSSFEFEDPICKSLYGKRSVPSIVSSFVFLMKEFGLFRIHRESISGEVEWYNVAEHTAQYLYLINQSLISPEDIEYMGKFSCTLKPDEYIDRLEIFFGKTENIIQYHQ